MKISSFELLAILLTGCAVAALAAPPELLKPCPGTPNCVSSLEGGETPLAYSDDSLAAWARARKAVEAIGGKIEEEREDYLRAVFTSLVFRFKDDLLLLHLPAEKAIHFRSASRTGSYDFGVNRRRVKRLRSEFGK